MRPAGRWFKPSPGSQYPTRKRRAGAQRNRAPDPGGESTTRDQDGEQWSRNCGAGGRPLQKTLAHIAQQGRRCGAPRPSTPTGQSSRGLTGRSQVQLLLWAPKYAELAQPVERRLAMAQAVGSNPTFRSNRARESQWRGAGLQNRRCQVRSLGGPPRIPPPQLYAQVVAHRGHHRSAPAHEEAPPNLDQFAGRDLTPPPAAMPPPSMQARPTAAMSAGPTRRKPRRWVSATAHRGLHRGPFRESEQ